MEASIRLGTIRGIPVGLHYSWFIVFFGFSALLALSQYPHLYPDWSPASYWGVAVASVLLLFFSVLLHEFGHALVSQRLGIPVVSITLFIFGGVAAISRDTDSPGDEFKIAIAGPIVSVLTGISFGAMWILFRGVSEQLGALLGYIAVVNIILAVFNMIPGFPLDGGRVLRAILWRTMGDMRRATAIVATIGSLFGSLLFVLGLLRVLQGDVANGVYFVAIGWFLQTAAAQGRAQVEQDALLRGVYVRDVMQRDPLTVEPYLSIQTLVDDYVLGRNVRGLPVTDDGQLLGIITVTDIKDLPQSEWRRFRVLDRMTRTDALKTVTEDTPMSEALQIMGTNDFHQMPVMRDGHLVGLVTRNGLVRYLQYRHELGVDRA